MPITKIRPTFTFTQHRLEELRAVVPEAFADGHITWETLRDVLDSFNCPTVPPLCVTLEANTVHEYPSAA